ncbi:hypothetical protein [Methylomonas sp. YC3]
MVDFNELPDTPVEMSYLLPYYRSSMLYSEFVGLNRKISMLHSDALSILYHLAKYSTGAIIEIGPYIGGSTIAIGMGIKDSGIPLVWKWEVLILIIPIVRQKILFRT